MSDRIEEIRERVERASVLDDDRRTLLAEVDRLRDMSDRHDIDARGVADTLRARADAAEARAAGYAGVVEACVAWFSDSGCCHFCEPDMYDDDDDHETHHPDCPLRALDDTSEKGRGTGKCER